MSFLLSALTVIGFVLMPATSHAYLDPGTGSMIIQVAIGSFLAAAYTLKVYWQRIRAFFSSRAKPSE